MDDIIIDRPWAILYPRKGRMPMNNDRYGLIYALGGSAKEAWRRAVRIYYNDGPMNDAVIDLFVRRLRAEGFRAKRVKIVSDRKDW